MKKKITIISIIILALLALIIVGILLFNKPNEKTPTPQTQTTQKQEQITGTVSEASWANGIWLNHIEKNNVTGISITQNPLDTATTNWTYDGITIASSGDGVITIHLKNKLIITGTVEKMFADMPELKSINGLELIDFSKSKNVQSLFQNCKKLEDVNFSFMDFSAAENTSYMFAGCESLTKIAFANEKLENVKTADSMFEDCYMLTEITVPYMPNVISAEKMFKNVGSSTNGATLTGKVDMPNCTNYNEMFKNTLFLDYSFVSSMNTSNMTTANGMFSTCGAEELNLSQWNVNKLTSAEKMFHNCAHLITINLNGWDCSNLQSCKEMFSKSTGTKEIILNWKNIENIKDVSFMFNETCSLKELDLTFFNNATFDNATQMFCCAEWLEKIKCTGFTASVADEMFKFCDMLKGNVEFNEAAIGVDMANTEGYFIS